MNYLTVISMLEYSQTWYKQNVLVSPRHKQLSWHLIMLN